MRWQPPLRTLAVMSKQTLAPQHEHGTHVVPRQDDEMRATPRACEASMVRARRWRQLSRWLSALVADDGMSERFVAERRRDDDLIRRVERRRRV
jgi:hypothetical protein